MHFKEASFSILNRICTGRPSHWVIILVLVTLSQGLFSQTERERLQRDKQKIEKEIDYTQELLNETQRSKQTSLNQLALLNRQMNRRADLIKLIDNELSYFDLLIQRNNDTVQRLKNELSGMKFEYAKMIYAANKQRNVYDRLMFIFAAEDFNQAYKRLKYFQQYGSYRKMQAERITETQKQLNRKISQLEVQRAEKMALRTIYEKEKTQLSVEQNMQNQSVKSLSKKEKELLKALKENEKALRRLQKAIEDIIAAEMKKSAAVAAKAGERPVVGYALTPAEKALSNNFELNKGKLPWPAERGVIASSFGEHPHPVLKGIKTRNNGIDIATNKGEPARAVFEGVVTNVLTIPSLNNVVIIRHGEFITVYSNLDQVFVEKGTIISTKQQIGIVHTDEDQTKTKLHFEIWKGKELLDPGQWIVKGSGIR